MFLHIESQLGDLKSFSKNSGGAFSTKNGITTATVTYTVIYENVVRTEEIKCIELEDGDHKIIGWTWKIQKEDSDGEEEAEEETPDNE